MLDSRSIGPVDGVDVLLKRDRTRLWYRAKSPIELSMSPVEALSQGKPVTAVRIVRAEPGPAHHTDRLVRESVARPRITAELAALLDEHSAAIEIEAGFDESQALTEWRDAPTHCPVLLLSASPILDARNPGPILGPGTQYRILAVTDGVVALKVAAIDGHVGVGYCNSVDLICFEPDIVYFRRERQTGKLGTAKLGLNRLSQRISGVTGSLVH